MAQRAGDIQIVVEGRGELGLLAHREIRGLFRVACVLIQPLLPLADSLERAARRVESLEREIQRQPIIHANERVSNLAPGVALCEQIAQREKIAERLRHLLPLDKKMSAVQPIFYEALARAAFALRDLGFVVRKNVV